MTRQASRDLFARRETLASLFALGAILIPVGFVIFNVGHTVMECSPESTSSPGVAELRRLVLVLTDGCNFYDVPLISIFGGVIAVLIVGFVVGRRIR